MNILNIHNGDVSANAARSAGIPGDHVPWRESLVTGRASAGLGRAEWIAIRAQHLSNAYGADMQRCSEEMIAMEEMLDASPAFDELVLWFDDDLFCQTILWYLLSRLESMQFEQTIVTNAGRISHPLADDPPEGTMGRSPEEIFALRTELPAELIAEGARHWRAYGSAEPTDLDAAFHLPSPTSARAQHAMFAHMLRYPSTHNGLNHIETLVITDLDEPTLFPDVFRRICNSGISFGYGDCQLWYDLQFLAAGAHPLMKLTGVGDPGTAIARGTFSHAMLSRTDAGTAVLLGEADAVKLNGVRRWLGGVWLDGGTTDWRWDRTDRHLVNVR
ncbi:MAG TPA: hypothetical protein VHI13_05985 [Candidatus Kapabacteria bacterium]|nr:hypothetical protein [Candidatus Kapabacteria bacterium]